MKVNRGKQFEFRVKQGFLNVPEVSVDRVHDQMTGYKVTSANICDFIVYKEPYEYYIECKTTSGQSLPFASIRENQKTGLLEKSKIPGVSAGIICWFINYDTTLYIPIERICKIEEEGRHSIRYDYVSEDIIGIRGRKRKILYEYDFSHFFKKMESRISRKDANG